MNSFVAARVKEEGAMCANKIPARSFPGSDMAERKRNSTGREVLPAETLADGLVLREAATEDSIPPHRIPRRERRAKPPSRAAAIAGLRPASFTISISSFYRRLEFCMLLNSGYLA